MSKNILQEALDEAYPEFEQRASGAYGEDLKSLVDSILESCDGEFPFTDVEAQFSALTEDIGKLEEILRAKIQERLSAESTIRP